MLTANIRFPEVNFKISIIALLAIYTVLFAITLNTYIQWQSVNFITGLLAIPVVANVSSGAKSYRYGIVALVFGVIAVLLPVNTILYFTFLFALLFVIESVYGKTNFLLLAIFVFLSPVFQYFINVFSFPIRLQLTALAGSIMNKIGMESVIQGNIILNNGNEFSVDPACMGLNMLQLSLIAGMVFMAHFQGKGRRSFSWPFIALVFAIVLLLNVFANLLRIVFMVQFTILPETIQHDFTGLVFFLGYIILPLYFIIKKIACRIKLRKRTGQAGYVKSISAKKIWTINSFLLVLVLITSFKNMQLKGRPVENWETTPKVNGYKVQCLPLQVLKLEKKGSLVYIKKIPAFYNADHTPYICWKGSGYSFQNIEKQLIGSLTVYAGKLVKGKDELFTAWWYQCGDKSTISQFTWRWDMLRGKGSYSVVNITAATKEELVKEVKTILNNDPFIHLLD